jgi:hypothetical protein
LNNGGKPAFRPAFLSEPADRAYALSPSGFVCQAVLATLERRTLERDARARFLAPSNPTRQGGGMGFDILGFDIH